MIIVNEVEFAELCLSEGLCGEKPTRVVFLLARYFYHEKHLKPRQIKAELYHFLDMHYVKYRSKLQMWTDKINKAVHDAKYRPLQHITGVSVRKSDMQRIRMLNSPVLERLAFTILCLAKYGNLKKDGNNNWVNYDWKTIFHMAHVSGGEDERIARMHALYAAGYIELTNRVNSSNFRITQIDEDGEEELFVSDFRELGYEYINYIKGGFVRCGSCDLLFKPTVHNQIYCPECQGYTPHTQRLVLCEDCGQAFFTSSKATKTTRCKECKTNHWRQYQKDWVKKKRESQGLSM